MSDHIDRPSQRETGDANWYRVADVGELADGTVKQVDIAGRPLVLIRVGNRYSVLDGRCPHMGGPLAEGSIENGLLVCPWHGREYDPASGRCEGYAESVRAYPVELRPDGVYAAI
jgi:nitrite reductase/ring-hydroxylating ferredoxin subunit